MNILIAALAASVACTNCNSTGWVSLPCPKCSGLGLLDPPKSYRLNKSALQRLSNGKIPCSACSKGLVSKDSKGTGQQRRTCPVCKGQKKIKKISTTH